MLEKIIDLSIIASIIVITVILCAYMIGVDLI